jgi:molybdopterin-containing oxidoreductase family iron-sulfur binding subunit
MDSMNKAARYKGGWKERRLAMENSSDSKGLSRRDFLKAGGMGVAAVAVLQATGGIATASSAIAGKRLAMVIDLHRCVACGACIIACKNENNIQEDVAWADRSTRTLGEFPNVRYEWFPTLCNHCDRAPCVKVCPTKAMHKADGGITTHDPGKCIGCRYCMLACPYGVIKYNWKRTHKFWRDDKHLIEGATPSSEEVAQKVGGNVIPYYNADRELFRPGSGLRYKGVVEKCTFCDHRVKRGELPYCIEACPANARIFGDLNDPNSDVSKVLGKYRSWRFKEELGTEPKVFYVRSFNPGSNVAGKGSI